MCGYREADKSCIISEGTVCASHPEKLYSELTAYGDNGFSGLLLLPCGVILAPVPAGAPVFSQFSHVLGLVTRGIGTDQKTTGMVNIEHAIAEMLRRDPSQRNAH